MMDVPATFKRANPLALPIAIFGIWVAWGSMYFFTHAALAEWPPYWLVGSRFFVAGLITFAFLRIRDRAKPRAQAPLPSRRQVLNCGIMAVCLLVFGTGSTVFAQQWNSSGLASTLAATATIWIALFMGFVGKWPRPVEWAGIVIGFAGVILINADIGMRGSLIGPAIGLFGTLSWSAGSVLSQKLDLPTGWMRTSIQMIIGGALLLLISLVRGEQVTLAVSAQTYGSWAVLIFGACLGFGSYMYLLSQSRISLATSYAYMNPAVALLLGIFIGHESVMPLELAGIAIILVSVVFISIANVRQATSDRREVSAIRCAGSCEERVLKFGSGVSCFAAK